MIATVLDNKTTRARVYTDGLEWYDSDYTTPPVSVCPFGNYIFYSPYTCRVEKAYDFGVAFIDNDGNTMAVVFLTDALALISFPADVEQGQPLFACSVVGNTMRSGLYRLSTGVQKRGAGFVVAFYNGYTPAAFFPDGATGGLVDITGTALGSRNPPAIVYDLRVENSVIDPHVEFLADGQVPKTPDVVGYLAFSSWERHTWGNYPVFVPSYETTDASAHALHNVSIPIIWAKTGNPVIPKTAPQSITIICTRNNVGYYRQVINTPPFFDGSLSWWTAQSLYFSGWYPARGYKSRASDETYTVYTHDENPPGYTIDPVNFNNVPNAYSDPSRYCAIIPAPAVAFLQEETKSGVDVLLLDKTHGVDFFQNFERHSNEILGDGVNITYTGAPYIKVWTGLLSTISADNRLDNTDSENSPPRVFYDVDGTRGIDYGDYAILAWAPSDKNGAPSINDDGIIPITFLLSRMGKIGKLSL